MYAKRYGVGLQTVIFGTGFMPEDEVMVWTTGVTRWLAYRDYVAESSSYYDSHCPEHIQDDPESFNGWLRAQREKEKMQMKSGR